MTPVKAAAWSLAAVVVPAVYLTGRGAGLLFAAALGFIGFRFVRSFRKAGQW